MLIKIIISTDIIMDYVTGGSKQVHGLLKLGDR